MAAVGLVSLLLSKYSSSDKDGTNEPNLISYTTACEEDPELKSFGSSLDQRFSKLNGSLTTEFFSLNAVKSVCGFLVEMNQNLAESIIANVDLLKNEELRSLVDLYYESSTSTLDLFNTVGNCTNKAKLSILIIRIAIQQFKKESMDTEIGGNKKKYAETLEELNNVKARGDPFGDEFKDQLKSVRAEHLKLLEKVHELVMKLEKQQEMCSNIVAVPSLAQGTAFGLNLLMAPLGLYLNEMMKNREKNLYRQKEVANIMEKNTNVNIQWTKTINSLVGKLTTSLSLILGSMELAVVKREEEAAKPLVEAILKEVDAFASTIQEFGEAVGKCISCVASGKLQVLEHITKSMSS
uniref:Uncharacterized protein n=1 Tax=Brassica campestris TaxID=3711 RepID=M4CJG1_BRACM